MKRILFLVLLILVPLQAYLQNAGVELLKILKTYNDLKYIGLEFTYVSANSEKDTFYLVNRGEVQFTNFKSKVYHRIGGLNIDIYKTNRFYKVKHFIMKSDLDCTTEYDPESSNLVTYSKMYDNRTKMYNQLSYTRFKANQVIPPLFLNDSSDLFNKRFFEKILSDLPVNSLDTMMPIVSSDTNYLGKYFRFDISFSHSNKIFSKWYKYFRKQFADSLTDKQFVIVVDKQTFLPVEYLIKHSYVYTETYKNIKIKIKNNNDPKNFNPFVYDPLPKMYVDAYLGKNGIVKGCEV